MAKLLTILMFILIGGMLSLPSSSACSARRRHNLTDSQLLQRIRQRYMFMENKLVHSSNQTQINGRINFVTGAKEGTDNCPWTWAIDDDPKRVPRFLAKAVCPQCNHYCRAVFYTHNSLVQRCDRKTGIIFWTRMERTLQIAYVYDH